MRVRHRDPSSSHALSPRGDDRSGDRGLTRPTVITLVALALALAAAAPAPAAPGLLRIVQDDASLLRSGSQVRDRALDELRAAGASVVRVNLVWRRHEGGGARAAWAAVDDLVVAARARGMRVLATPTTPAPDRWAARRPGMQPGTWRPDPRAFAAFVERAARRYDGGAGSPGRVELWSLVNEPNNPNHLTPQHRGRRRVSPALYRALLRAALPRLAAAGHSPQSVLIGEQLGVARRGAAELTPVRPRAFLRDLLCLDDRDRPTARPPGCRGRFAPLDVGGWSVHPYPPTSGPGVLPPNRDTLVPATIGRLLPTLDAASRFGRTARRLDLWDTEQGIQTNPPDRAFGAPPARQAAYLNQIEAMLWRAPRVRSWTQYLWRDEPRLGSFQSGLRFRDGRPKPALAAYRLPLVVRRTRAGRAWLWARLPAAQPAHAVVNVGGRPRLVGPARADGVITATLRLPRRRTTVWIEHGGRRSRTVAVAR